MISSDWLFQWKCFISNKVSAQHADQVRASENDRIGVLPPGSISNHDLLVKTSNGDFQIKPNLLLNEHYRGVNKDVWHLFHNLYGGGPVLVR